MTRKASVNRKTRETDIKAVIDLDGSGIYQIDTGIGFFDHMLSGFARHGFFDLSLSCKGDLDVDCHHTIEDCGIVLGQAIAKALGDKEGIRRFGSSLLPMDEALVRCVIDLSGRPYLVFNEEFSNDRVGDFDTEMVREFFYAISYSSMMTLHIDELHGENSHHLIEASFKAFGKALHEAVTIDQNIKGVLSTKGSL
ncbi:imidazoleglycerol-phosphate dehydratase HisB [Candidatus Weimeria sp. HCP3S3_B5]|uniref:imidazoleglycerol-phosphate dehydratase HisB n=1 Tax=Candidatus Weimeria sp. HCP3S3_B5 TaxID=3438871 RepID=UPI002A93C55A|nr:imidazoleglycerol-phosphate dehydratase HisB [Lachnospiraceae bacterium]MDY6352340.1 imidazoleglycerol-phosphate dehydratase HisB [Lachnospiraceae bacterium]